MKKSIFTLALAAVLGISASAQTVPNTFNYQGVDAKHKGEAIEVTFNVRCDGDYVYAETHEVTTNENGAFSVILGSENPAAWDAIDWTAGYYTVTTTVNGTVVSTTGLQAVPYANVAGSVVGLDTQVVDFLVDDVADLVMANRENKTDIAELKATVDGVVENLDMTIPVLQEMEDAIEALTAGSDVLSTDLADLVMANRENKTDIAELKATVDGVVENLDMTIPVLQEMEDAIEALTAGSDVLSTDLADLVMANRENKTDIAELKATVDGVVESLDMTIPVLQEMEAAIEENADVTAQLNAAFTNFTKYVDEDLMGAVAEELEALKAGSDVLSTDLADLVMANRENKTDIAELKATVEGVVENLDMTIPVLQEMEAAIEDNADVTAQLNKAFTDFTKYVDEDLMGAVAEELEAVKLDLESVGLAADQAGTIAAQTYEDLADVQETLSQIVYMLTEDDGEFAELTKGFTQLSRIVDALVARVEALEAAEQ